jgi:hypothetical protein
VADWGAGWLAGWAGWLAGNTTSRLGGWLGGWLSVMYGLTDPLQCLQSDPPQKSVYKEHILTKVTAFHEKELRQNSLSNSNMMYLNVSVCGLRGKRHPALSNLLTAFNVKKSRPHLKMLCMDYYTYEKRADQSGGSPHCRSCSETNQEMPPAENIHHIITQCNAYLDIRERILQEFKSLCEQSKSKPNFTDIQNDESTLCQFILDPTSLNLESRICPNDPKIDEFFDLSRDICYSIHTRRMKILKEKSEEKKKKMTLPEA